MNIEGTIALVTGANGGIGKHYSEALQVTTQAALTLNPSPRAGEGL